MWRPIFLHFIAVDSFSDLQESFFEEDHETIMLNMNLQQDFDLMHEPKDDTKGNTYLK